MIERKYLYKILNVMCVIILILSIFFVIKSSDLIIKLKRQKSTSLYWDIGFTEGKVKSIKKSTIGKDSTCGEILVTNNTISINETELKDVGDTCIYELTIQNRGMIDAKLETVTNILPNSTNCTTSESSYTCDGINYQLSSNKELTKKLETNELIVKKNNTRIYIYIYQ